MAFIFTSSGAQGTPGSSGLFVRTSHIGNVSITGDLTVTSLIATTTITTGDNLIVLNDDVVGAPSENAGIEIVRGTSANVQVLWDETGDRFQAGEIGSLSNLVRESDLSSSDSSISFGSASDFEVDIAAVAAGTVASGDLVLISDIDDSNSSKQVTAQSIADLAGGGSGDVVGPASSLNNAVARYDTTTGKLLQDSLVTLGDTEIMEGSNLKLRFSSARISGKGFTQLYFESGALALRDADLVAWDTTVDLGRASEGSNERSFRDIYFTRDLLAQTDGGGSIGFSGSRRPSDIYVVDTVDVGTEMRLKGTDGAPGTPRDGDLWTDTNVVTMRSNGLDFSFDSLLKHLVLTGEQFRKGVTAPTDVTIGTTPTIPALLFNATGELASIFLEFPADMNKTLDSKLVLIVALSAVELNNDTLDITTDYTVPVLGTTGSGLGKASTQLLDTTTVTTGAGLAVGDLYKVEIDFSAGDATNPTASGLGIATEIHLTNVTGVGEFHLVSGYFEYTGTH